ncbi:GNAT family N-acetyltransferase [Candidatus Bipolaricaulota bacterium]
MNDLRRATREDAEALAVVHVAAWRAAYAGIVPDAVLEQRDVAYRTKRFREFLSRNEGETYILEREAAVIGFMTIGAARDENAAASETGEIWGIYLHPGHWRQGIGTSLFRSAQTMLREQGFSQIVLWVLEENTAARRFYEAMSFRVDGADKELTLGRPLRAIRYRKVLPAA